MIIDRLYHIGEQLDEQFNIYPSCYKIVRINQCIDIYLNTENNILTIKYNAKEERHAEKKIPDIPRTGKNYSASLISDKLLYLLNKNVLVNVNKYPNISKYIIKGESKIKDRQVKQRTEKEESADIKHKNYKDLMLECYEKTQNNKLKSWINYFEKNYDQLIKNIDNSLSEYTTSLELYVRIYVDDVLLTDIDLIKNFYNNYIKEKFTLPNKDIKCTICNSNDILNTCPFDFQNIPLLSVNMSESFKLKKLQNIPICYYCIDKVFNTINYLVNKKLYYSFGDYYILFWSNNEKFINKAYDILEEDELNDTLSTSEFKERILRLKQIPGLETEEYEIFLFSKFEHRVQMQNYHGDKLGFLLKNMIEFIECLEKTNYNLDKYIKKCGVNKNFLDVLKFIFDEDSKNKNYFISMIKWIYFGEKFPVKILYSIFKEIDSKLKKSEPIFYQNKSGGFFDIKFSMLYYISKIKELTMNDIDKEIIENLAKIAYYYDRLQQQAMGKKQNDYYLLKEFRLNSKLQSPTRIMEYINNSKYEHYKKICQAYNKDYYSQIIEMCISNLSKLSIKNFEITRDHKNMIGFKYFEEQMNNFEKRNETMRTKELNKNN